MFTNPIKEKAKKIVMYFSKFSPVVLIKEILIKMVWDFNIMTVENYDILTFCNYDL